MKMRSIILLAVIPIALLLQGCATPPRIASNTLQNLAYGQTFSDVQKLMRSNVADCFIIRQTNTVYECKMISVFDTQKSYLLLFKDAVFVSALNAVEERKHSKWIDFSNLSQPDFTQVNVLVEDFFPPPSLTDFQFTNSSNFELANQREKEGEKEGLGMAIGLSPFWIPTAPVWIPLMIHDNSKWQEFYGKLKSLKTGESKAEVIRLLGKPTKIYGSENESIWVVKNMYGCLGFENGELVWILFNYTPIER
jgi:hypothetical protein